MIILIVIDLQFLSIGVYLLSPVSSIKADKFWINQFTFTMTILIRVFKKGLTRTAKHDLRYNLFYNFFVFTFAVPDSKVCIIIIQSSLSSYKTTAGSPDACLKTYFINIYSLRPLEHYLTDQ